MTTPAISPPERHLRARELIYLLLLAAAVTANAVFQLDPDPGGYQDRWLTIDKMVHFAVAYAVVIAGRMAGVRQSIVLGGITAAAVAFEYTQGFVAWRDIIAGWAGAGTAAMWWLIPERRQNPR
jgi:hypothetical protein